MTKEFTVKKTLETSPHSLIALLFQVTRNARLQQNAKVDAAFSQILEVAHTAIRVHLKKKVSDFSVIPKVDCV